MKTLRHFTTIVCLSMAPLAIADPEPGTARTEPTPSEQSPRVDVRALLEKGLASGTLPEDMAIRVGACLGEPDAKGVEERIPAGMSERWEFTSGKVHRIRRQDEEDKGGGQGESRKFDSKGLCQDLLMGKAVEIAAGKGEGPETGFAGSRYQRGSRYIKVVWKGGTILELSETNGAFLELYRESDARAFGALYERLAGQARAAFQAETAPGK